MRALEETAESVVIRFEIEDSGAGISAEAQSRLFQPFTQADSSTTRKFGGTGLGLAVSRQLVSMMHGEIGVRSALEHGATFWFTARFEKGDEADGRAGCAQAVASVAWRALVVDGNSVNREILCKQIEEWGMDCTGAGNASEALEVLRAAAAEGKRYDCALIEVDVSRDEGLALARAIRADAAVAGARLILFTGSGQVLSREMLQNSGVDEHLVKLLKRDGQARVLDDLARAGESSGTQNGGSLLSHKSTAWKAMRLPQDLRILLAEDHLINQKVGLLQLKKLGLRADIASNGREAVAALEKSSYDVILMDCQMPEMDGFEATRLIRKRENDSGVSCPWEAPVRIVALTANAMQGDREECLAAGMDDYLSKPVRTSDLQAALERWLPASHIARSV